MDRTCCTRFHFYFLHASVHICVDASQVICYVSVRNNYTWKKRGPENDITIDINGVSPLAPLDLVFAVCTSLTYLGWTHNF